MVSVIIPNYNHAGFLRQRIDSVLNQTYRDMEVIILDDCSTDDSRAVIEGYRGRDRVAAIVYNEQNSGSTFRQWQKGIAMAKGDLIWIAESDDWCEDGLLQELVTGILRNKDTVLGYVQSQCIKEGQVEWTSTYPEWETKEGVAFIGGMMIDGNAIFNASMAVFKKTAFMHVPDDYLNYTFCGDWVFWISIALQGKVFISDKVLNYFRKHGGDVSGKAYLNGTYFMERNRLLVLLLVWGIIGEERYAQLLVDHHLHYLVKKGSYSKEVQQHIEGSFYGIQDGKYKDILLRTGRQQRFKNLFKTAIGR